MLRWAIVDETSGLSVIIITLNEERDIERCLRSVKEIADEIVVVDSGSTDRTVEIARRYTDKIIHRDWDGYSSQKQFALEKAKGPWVLNLDADERLRSELQNEIKQILEDREASGGVNGFAIPFRHYFWGRRLRFGGSQGEKHVRLFRKTQARYGDDKIHEGINVNPPVKTLKGTIDHFSYRDIDEYLEKCARYTFLIAEKKFKQGKRFRSWHHLRLPFEFLNRYVFKLGFLDGGPGLIYAVLSSYYVWLKFVRLWEFEELSKEKGIE